MSAPGGSAEAAERTAEPERRPSGGGGEGAPPPPREGSGRKGRFWSSRRGPASLVALVILAAAALLLYDVASVRAGRGAMSWRRTLADGLATTRVDNVYVLAGAAAAAAVGLWLLVLAVTPGRREVLTMRPDVPQVRAGLERPAAALVLRDRAMEVSGVRSARVKVRRRKVVARAESHFRDLDVVRSDLEGALSEGIGQLGLAHRPRLSVRVGRPKKT
ncbi:MULTISPECIES: DUF6286 domain-containing protein [Streptomyces]|uniref:DUF6286 domain-containing protein n=1 Tax=Streptomyces TaxID=1883 RepID=UPI001916EF04|nr:DUF6286 domain-containing protein [Streptomyces sp. NHF165]